MNMAIYLPIAMALIEIAKRVNSLPVTKSNARYYVLTFAVLMALGQSMLNDNLTNVDLVMSNIGIYSGVMYGAYELIKTFAKIIVGLYNKARD